MSRHDGWAWRGSASAVGVLMLLTACRPGSDYCEQLDDVSSSLDALVNTALLGEGGVRAEFEDRFDAFQGELEDFLDALPDEFDDQAATAQTAVDAMSDELGSRATDRAGLATSYRRLTSEMSALIDAVDAAC
jgi:hypothetical protein